MVQEYGIPDKYIMIFPELYGILREVSTERQLEEGDKFWCLDLHISMKHLVSASFEFACTLEEAQKFGKEIIQNFKNFKAKNGFIKD